MFTWGPQQAATILAAGNATIEAGYSVMSSGNATFDIGYEILDVVIEDVIVAPLEGTNGQTVGVPNNGTAGGTFTLALGASIQTEARYTGTSSLRLISGNSSDAFMTLAPTTLVYTPGTPFNLDFAFRMEGGVSPDSQELFRLYFDPFLFADRSTSPVFWILVRARQDKDDISVSFTDPNRGDFGRFATLPAEIGLQKQVWHHLRASMDATGRMRGFVNGVDCSVFNVMVSPLTGPSRRMQLRAFEGSTSPTHAGRVGFIDDIRLRYGEASTGAFTPPPPSRLQGNAKLSVGFEMEFQPEPPLFVRVSSEFTGTNGQTTGIANAGTLGGNLTFNGAVSLSSAQAFSPPTSLLLNTGVDEYSDATFTGASGAYGPIANSFDCECRIRLPSSAADCSGGLAVSFLRNYFFLSFEVVAGQIKFSFARQETRPLFPQSYALDTWHKLRIERNSSTGLCSISINDVLVDTVVYTDSAPTDSFFGLKWIVYGQGPGLVYIDSATLRLP